MRTARASALPLVVAVVLAAAAVRAQDDPTAAPCEQRLRQLQEQLRQAENRNKDLTREIERLRQQLAEAKGAGPAKPAKKDAAPAEPLASPHDLFDSVLKDYREKVAHLPRDTKAEQARYQQAAREWARDAARTFRGPVNWTIRVVGIEGGTRPGERFATVTFVVLDSASQPIGEPVSVPIAAPHLPVLREGIGAKTFKLVGTAGARPTVNPQRAEKGSVDSPRFLGPYTEYDWDLAVQSILPMN